LKYGLASSIFNILPRGYQPQLPQIDGKHCMEAANKCSEILDVGSYFGHVI